MSKTDPSIDAFGDLAEQDRNRRTRTIALSSGFFASMDGKRTQVSDVVTYSPPAGTTDLRRRGPEGPAAPVRVLVCTMCNDRLRGSGGLQAGRYLLAEVIAAGGADATIDIAGIECMSVCKAKITVSFSAPSKWSHVFAIPSNTDPALVLEGARRYARSRTGIFPLDGCEALRSGVIARVPPVG